MTDPIESTESTEKAKSIIEILGISKQEFPPEYRSLDLQIDKSLFWKLTKIAAEEELHVEDWLERKLEYFLELHKTAYEVKTNTEEATVNYWREMCKRVLSSLEEEECSVKVTKLCKQIKLALYIESNWTIKKKVKEDEV